MDFYLWCNKRSHRVHITICYKCKKYEDCKQREEAEIKELLKQERGQ